MTDLKPLRTLAQALAARSGSILLSAAILVLLTATANAATLWYNGDADNQNAYVNQNNSVAQQVLYNDFNVPAPGWDVRSVWSNNVFLSGVPASTTATWAIYKDMGSGPTSGGTIVATGDSAATLVPTGLTINIPGEGVNNLPEYSVLVSGLNVTLAPGLYWLGVYPDNTSGGLAGNDETLGVGGIGSPTGNNNNLYGTNTPGPPISNDPNFASGQNNALGTSAGISGILLPEPGAVTLMCVGAIGLFAVARRRRKS